MRQTKARQIRRSSTHACIMRPQGLASLLAAALFTIPLTAGAAPAVPNPGVEVRQPAEQGKTALENDLPASQAQKGQDVRFTLSKIRVDHEGMKLSEAGLDAITKPLLNREISATELNATVAELTKYARQSGYTAAVAYIPEQTAKDGELLLRFEPGRFAEVKAETNGVLKEKVAHRPLAGLKKGEIITNKALEESLRNLRDIPGIRANAVLSPGPEQGTSNLTVKVEPKDPTTYILYAENYGSKAAGRYRYGLQADWKNLGGTGSRLNVGALISNGKQHGGNIAYEIPVGHSMTTLGLAYSHSDYELGSIWSQLGVEGKSDTVSLYGRTPLLNYYTNDLNLTYAVNYRKLKDEFNGMDIGDRHTTSFSIGLEGTTRTTENVLHYNAAFHTGNVTPDSDIARTLADLQGTRGRFSKGTLDLTAVQKISGPFDVMLKLSGQKAASNLDSSEHIYLGGARGIRAYPQGEGSGDEGILGNLELRYHTPVKGLVLSTYFDAGTVKAEKSQSGNTTLKGWGIGLTYSKPNDWFARVDYARRIGFADNLSRDAESRGRIWFMAGKIF